MTQYVLVGRMDDATREDGGTHAYTVMERDNQWVMVSSESDAQEHPLVDSLAGRTVRVTIEVIE